MEERYEETSLEKQRKLQVLKMFYISFAIFVAATCLWILFFSGGQVEDPEEIALREGKQVLKLWGGTAGDRRAITVIDKVNANLDENFFRLHPELTPGRTTRLLMPQAVASGSILMSLAGGTAPDVINYNILQSQTLMDQGFLEPLERFIEAEVAKDPDFEKRIYIPSKLRPVITRLNEASGKMERHGLIRVYGIKALVYRKDLFLEAGLDPKKPPQTWEEMFRYAVRLTRPEKAIEGAEARRGQIGLFFDGLHFFMQFTWQAGGDMVRKFKVCPKTGKEVSVKKEEDFDFCPECNADVSKVPVQWKVTWAEEAGVKTLDYLKKLRWTPWIRVVDDEGNEKEYFFSYEDFFKLRSTVTMDDGTVFDLNDEEVRERAQVGCAYVAPRETKINEIHQMFARGEIAMMDLPMQEEYLVNMEKEGVNFDLVDVAALPCIEGGTPWTHLSAGMWGINSQTSEETKWKAWEYIKYACGDAAWKEKARIYVENGMHYLVRPHLLKKFGYDEFYSQINPQMIEVYDHMENYARSMPWNEGWMPLWSAVLPQHVETVSFETDGWRYDAKELLGATQDIANRTVLKVKDEGYYSKIRVFAYIIFIAVSAFFIWAIVYISRSKAAGRAGGMQFDVVGMKTPRYIIRQTIIAWLFLVPAILSVLVWRYIPLGQGAGMALYEYKLLEGFSSQFVGIDNFIDIFHQQLFYEVIWNTFYYVSLVLGLGFLVPIILALLLAEAPWGSLGFRIIFYLPAIMSPLVTLLLWQLLYDPSEFGLLNQLLIKIRLVDRQAPLGFLQNKDMAMLCIIIPGIWAHAGPGSIIYLAALKVVPEDLYEAVAVDGGTLWHKIRLVTFPALAPLIVINFIGAFIGAWQAMQNIFVLTGGGPGNATRVIGIEIWYNAFVYLRFGYSTAMAWILASMLIGFTVLQLRMFSKVEFKAAQGN